MKLTPISGTVLAILSALAAVPACSGADDPQPGSSEGGAGGTGGSGPSASSGGNDSSSGGSVTDDDPNTCDAGSTTTVWAQNCATTAPTCKAGTWTEGSKEPSQGSGFNKLAETDHFVLYNDDNSLNTSAAEAALKTLEDSVWKTYFGSPMFKEEPYCNSSTKLKAGVYVHSDWGLTGGAWDTIENGSTVTHLGIWIGPGGAADHWGLAHEFMHSVQASSKGLICSKPDTCGWIHESHANFSAHQLPETHQADVNCSEMLVNVPHLYLGSTRDRYCNWQFMEFLKDKYCFAAVNDIWDAETEGADPFLNIMSTRGWTLDEMNDFFGEWSTHNITWDYQDPAPQVTGGQNQSSFYRSKYGSMTDTSPTNRSLRLTELESVDLEQRRFAVNSFQAPQRYGYNVIRILPDSGANEVRLRFQGVAQDQGSPDFRWALVATDAAITTARYGRLHKGTEGSANFCLKDGELLWLVVMATPSTWQSHSWDQPYDTVRRYPYLIDFENAWPANFPGGAQEACPSGLTRVSNGGGCAPAGLSSSVYVGPYAKVFSTATVTGSARIEDHAWVVAGSVSGGTVGAPSHRSNRRG